ncbi:MAG: structural protein [Caudoviricetes sp.]|nr:MAG: structural protein [Caudoviricetes sp.]
MRTRIEILKDNKWLELVLKSESIKYNILCNKIGNFESRKLNHSDTFSLPYVSENIIALDINVFSPILMAEALNKKFQARYYVKDKLLQRGFLVINNTIRGEINVNFIDEALVIVDEWGKYTYKQLLNDFITFPGRFPLSVVGSSFKNILTNMQTYETSKTKKVVAINKSISELSDDESIVGRESFIARYPNPLNNIGDKFQVDSLGIRRKDFFNPFQSRPIFSQFSFLYLISQIFGYRLKLDPGVDFISLRDTYMTSKGILDSTPISDALINSETSTISSSNVDYSGYHKNGIGVGDNEGFYEFFFPYPNTTVVVENSGRKVGIESLTPREVPGGYTPSKWLGSRVSDIQNKKIVAKIESDPFIGNVVWEGSILKRTPDNRFIFREIKAISVWKTNRGLTIEAPFNGTVETVVSDPIRSFKVVGDKGQLNNKPANAETFIGLVLKIIITHKGGYWNDVPTLTNSHFYEEVLPKGTAEVDNFGQFLQSKTNLLNYAPDTSIKELLSNILQQQGLLLTFERDGNGTQNIVKLFTYGAYRNRVQESRTGVLNKFYNWSEFHQRLVPPLFNTEYGEKYGEVNEISLTDPFQGNISKVQISTNITNKGFKTKLIPLAKNQTSSFKDVTSVTVILDSEPFFEYANKEQGLVSCSFDKYLPGIRKQYNAEEASSFINNEHLPEVSNVIYSDGYFPVGIKEWYYLVDVAVKCQATFLLPISVIQNFDISLPIYSEALGGFYIVEEVGEYIDDLTPVKVNLIKLPL